VVIAITEAAQPSRRRERMKMDPICAMVFAWKINRIILARKVNP
jgi:hypothetical protein